MLFLYRPRQTWMPYALPRSRTQQAAYNRQLQDRFASTRRVAPVEPAAAVGDPIADLRQLGELHRSGVLTDAEFEALKAKLLAR
jgi:Short C-terminal domain